MARFNPMMREFGTQRSYAGDPNDVSFQRNQGPGASGGGGSVGSFLPVVGPTMDTLKLYQSGQGTGFAPLDAIQQIANFAGGLGPQAPEKLNINKPQVDQGAMGRRLTALNGSPLMELRQGIDSLKHIENPEQRAALAKPLLQAEYLAKRGVGV